MSTDYVLEGQDGTPYEGGYYHGKIIFPPQYPFKPPSILMLTPSGERGVEPFTLTGRADTPTLHAQDASRSTLACVCLCPTIIPSRGTLCGRLAAFSQVPAFSLQHTPRNTLHHLSLPNPSSASDLVQQPRPEKPLGKDAGERLTTERLCAPFPEYCRTHVLLLRGHADDRQREHLGFG